MNNPKFSPRFLKEGLIKITQIELLLGFDIVSVPQ